MNRLKVVFQSSSLSVSYPTWKCQEKNLEPSACTAATKPWLSSWRCFYLAVHPQGSGAYLWWPSINAGVIQWHTYSPPPSSRVSHWFKYEKPTSLGIFQTQPLCAVDCSTGWVMLWWCLLPSLMLGWPDPIALAFWHHYLVWTYIIPMLKDLHWLPFYMTNNATKDGSSFK